MLKTTAVDVAFFTASVGIFVGACVCDDVEIYER